jgi:D-glycero-alpha-D-manno-heptose 1-phosphate guanylyltransferase
VVHRPEWPTLLVLAGGFGTRLKSALDDCPKALAPVGGTPFLGLLLEAWRQEGVRDILFMLHHKSDQISNYLEKNSDSLLESITWATIREEVPLGTGGAIANAVQNRNLSGNILVVNADTWTNQCLDVVRSAPCPAMGVVHIKDTSRYGTVEFDENHIVTGFHEKKATSSESGWINAGVYLLNAEMFRNWDGKPFSLEQDFFPKMVEQRQLHSVSLATDFIDIGVPDDYHRFVDWVMSGREEPL